MATASVLVTNGTIMVESIPEEYDSDRVSGTDISASLSLANTIVDILTTSDIFKDLSDEIDNKYSYKELRNMATVNRKSDHTLFVNVSFTASSSSEAIMLVNKFVSLAPDYIVEYIPLSKAMVAATADSTTVVFPKTPITTLVAAMVGALVAFGIAFMVESMDHAINGEEDFVSKYEIPLLGSVPDFETTMLTGSSSYYKKGGYQSGT
jgi:capsular polysaccharide biosynthesis protein